MRCLIDKFIFKKEPANYQLSIYFLTHPGYWNLQSCHLGSMLI